MDNLTDMLKGVLESCVLEIISRGDTYGPMDNSYHSSVSRSTSIHGPFTDKDGWPITALTPDISKVLTK